MLERKKYFSSCKVLKDSEIRHLAEGFLKKTEIRGRDLMFSRGEGPKSDKDSLHRMNMKEIMKIYLREVSDIGSKSMLQKL